VIGPETVQLLEGGCGLVIGTVARDGMPHASRAWGLDVLDPEQGRIRVMLADDDPVTLENLKATGRIAITGTDVATLRSVQVKGRVLSIENATVAHRHRAERFCNAFLENVHRVDATPRALLERIVPRGYRTCVVTLDEVFEQTPGPRAGSRLNAGSR
jgi:hypothetical protein